MTPDRPHRGRLQPDGKTIQSAPERKRWYERLLAASKLDAHRVRDDWEGRKNIMRSFGFLFFTVGLVLLGPIV